MQGVAAEEAPVDLQAAAAEERPKELRARLDDLTDKLTKSQYDLAICAGSSGAAMSALLAQ